MTGKKQHICRRCGKTYTPFARSVLCGSCFADYMNWKQRQTGEKFAILHGHKELDIVTEAKLRVEIKRNITIEDWVRIPVEGERYG